MHLQSIGVQKKTENEEKEGRKLTVAMAVVVEEQNGKRDQM